MFPFINCLLPTAYCWLDPLAVLLDQPDQAAYSFVSGNALLDALLANEEVDLAGRAAHVAEVGVGKLAQPVDDAAHDGYLHAAQVTRGAFYPLRGLLQVEESAPARWAGHELGLDGTRARRLE